MKDGIARRTGNSLRRLARPVARAAALVTCLTAVGVLAVDWVVDVQTSSEAALRLEQAEEAARSDPDAAPALQAEVERQTARSLARAQRQRAAGILALVAAGSWLALMKVGQPASPRLPHRVVEAANRTQRVPETTEPESQERSAGIWDDGFDRGAGAPELDLAPVQGIVTRLGCEEQQLIPLLHAVNQQYHYLPQPALVRLAESTGIRYERVAEVASFYAQFRKRPRGRHLIQICRGTACHVAGADRIVDELRRILGVRDGADTDADGAATIETVGCLGCCTLAPVVSVDEQLEGYVTVRGLEDLVDWNRVERQSVTIGPQGSAATAGTGLTTGNALTRDATRQPIEIRVGFGSCCVAGGSCGVMDGLRHEIAARHLNAVIKPVGCVGICHLTPMVEIVPPDSEPIVATRVTQRDMDRLLDAILQKSSWQQRWRNRMTGLWPSKPLSRNGSAAADGGRAATEFQLCPGSDDRLRRFVDPQVRIVTEHSGEMDPTSLEQYRARDGFVALQQCLEQRSSEDILAAIEASGLRGRGGGGFPTGTKWRKVQAAAGKKVLVCNGDEGDPGAFMDRMVMESYPFRVLEGMAIAARAVGAQRAYVYVRHEYPLAVKRLRNAIERMVTAGWLGDAIQGSDFCFHVELVEGAGAFVCGEETALLQSIMGRRGTPQLRPPYPVERGLFGQPTLINNVETYANVPWILRNGPHRFAALGTETSKGTKVFSLSGKVRSAGLIEIPLGLTIREVVERIGGGVSEGKRFKAVQIGGPSGGCVPAELADTPIDYEHLKQVGAILGSGGLVVLDDDDCMVDVARYFLEFTQKESCGHCTFCRVGTRKLLDILERLCAGQGKARDLDEIESLARSVALGSLCGLGKTAPNPVLSTLRYFRDEYEAHLKGQCPAGRCKALIRYEVGRECVGCTLCAQHCPVGAIPLTPYRQHVIDSDVCSRCDVCRQVCPEQAIRVA